MASSVDKSTGSSPDIPTGVGNLRADNAIFITEESVQEHLRLLTRINPYAALAIASLARSQEVKSFPDSSRIAVALAVCGATDPEQVELGLHDLADPNLTVDSLLAGN